MGFLTLAFGSVRNDEKRDCTITTNYAASKTTLFRRMVDFDNPPASLRSAPSRIGLPQKDAVFLWDFHREGKIRGL